MALIKFKRGTQTSLNTMINAKTGEDGVFYLTTDADSARLYVGKEGGAIVPVNQGIITVDNVSQLSDGTLKGTYKAGDFAYVTNGNILAVRSNNSWIQINTAVDTYLSEGTYNLTPNETDNSVKIEFTGSYNNGSDTLTADHTIKGANGVKVTAIGTNVTITGDRTKVSSAVANNAVTISAKGEDNTDNGSVKLAGGSNVTITSTTDGATIAATNNILNEVQINNLASGFQIVTSDSESKSVTSNTIDPVLKYGGSGTTEAKFNNGAATLSVYTKDEVDNKFKTLDGVVYKGTVGTNGSAAASIAAITSASAGDMFKASSDMTLAAGKSSTKAAVNVKAGDLLIAVGEEDTSGTLKEIRFDVIPSGDDVDTTYSTESITGGIALNNDVTNTSIGGLAVAGGDLLSISEATDNSTKVKTVTINHDNVTTTPTAGTAVSVSNGGNGSFTAITGITTNKGHVTGYTTQAISITDTNATLSESVTNVTTASDRATIATTSKLTHSDNATEDTVTSSYSIGSSTMQVTSSGAAITMDMVWGTF